MSPIYVQARFTELWARGMCAADIFDIITIEATVEASMRPRS